jgi:hypothetical protein
MSKQQIETCAAFIEALLELDGDTLEELINETALAAGYTEPEIEEAWAIVNDREGA